MLVPGYTGDVDATAVTVMMPGCIGYVDFIARTVLLVPLR